jgi:metal-dependent amidase/aminoacylase/carboxypeptidase family protein
VDRALKAGALALGARVEIATLPGYLPLVNDARLLALYRANFERDYAPEQWTSRGHGAGSTDMGDLSHLMPTIQPYAVGAHGQGHGSDWGVADPYVHYVVPAKLMALTVVDLLADDAREARALLDGYRPRLTKADYLAFMRRMVAEQTFDGAAF